MTHLQALFLGIVQGITEFLPVSSSGHLALVEYFLGLENLDHYITFDLVCHLGTLCAIFAIYLPEIRNLLLTNTLRLKQVILGTLPLFPVLLVLKPVEKLYNQTELIGFFLLITAALLYAGIRWGRQKPAAQLSQHWASHALLIGVFQAFALMPGVSRSGSTISAARLLGWDSQAAVTFSFLLAIPAILGGTTLKLLQLAYSGSSHEHIAGLSHYLAGFISSFVVGYLSLFLLIKLAAKEKFLYFVWYCLLLGLATTFYFYVMQ